VKSQEPRLPPPPAADRTVLVTMLTATAKSVGWEPFTADSSVDRVTVTFIPRTASKS
jgi:hypothetical protein